MLHYVGLYLREELALDSENYFPKSSLILFSVTPKIGGYG